MSVKGWPDDACGYSYTCVMYTRNDVVVKYTEFVPVRSLTGR